MIELLLTREFSQIALYGLKLQSAISMDLASLRLVNQRLEVLKQKPKVDQILSNSMKGEVMALSKVENLDEDSCKKLALKVYEEVHGNKSFPDDAKERFLKFYQSEIKDQVKERRKISEAISKYTREEIGQVAG